MSDGNGNGGGLVVATGLVKRFGENAAVDGVSFEIREGEVFGLLGPNGAGKTTAISMISCLIAPTAGVDTTVTVVEDPRSTAYGAVAQAVQGRVQRIAANGTTIGIVRQAFRDASTLTDVLYSPPAPRDVYTYADRIWSPTPPLSVEETAVTRSQVRGNSEQPMGFQQYSLGFTLMFMLFMGMGSAGGLLDEREQGRSRGCSRRPPTARSSSSARSRGSTRR